MLEILLLGPLEVRRNEATVRIPGRLLPALLAMLALAAGRPVPCDTLVEWLWADKQPRDSRRTLHTYMSRIRTLVGADLIGSTGDNYVLLIESRQVDALRMIELIRTAPEAGPTERDQLALAVGLWRSEPFVQSVSEWLAGVEGPRLTELYLSAAERRIDLDLAARRYDGLASELQELTSLHPLRESLWTRRIRVLSLLSRPAEALEQYGVVRATIARELGVQPGAELQRLHCELLAVDDVSTPAAVVPRQLPLDLARFTGRTDTLAALDSVLADRATGEVAIASVHGAGGVGKSSAVVHWAYSVQELFPDGQLFIDLRGHGPDQPVPPAAALDGMLRALGVPGELIPAELGARSALLRSTLAGRRILIVLDNALDTAQVRPLLPGTGPLVVVTSRIQLRGLAAREGARRIAVGRLTEAESVELLRAVLPERSVDHAILAELARLCDGLPLALAIVAEQAAVLSDDELAALISELQDRQARLDVLDSDEDPLASVRAVLSASYDVLHARGARLFRLLGVHPGSDFDGASASALAGSDAAAELLCLVDAHLIEQHRPGRYRLHDLVRLFAAEAAADDPRSEEASERLDSWYLHTAAAGRLALGQEPLLTKLGEPLTSVSPLAFDDRASALAWFSDERSNLAAVIRRAADTGRHRTAYSIAHVLWAYLLHQHVAEETFELQAIAARAAEAAGDDAAIATSAAQLSHTFTRAGQHAQAIRQLGLAIQHWQLSGNEHGLASALASLGTAYQGKMCFAEAQAALSEGLETARRIGSVDLQLRLLNNLAMNHIGLKNFDAAIGSIRDAFGLVPDYTGWLAPYLWDTLARAQAGQGSYDEAVEAFHHALDLYREVGNHQIQAPVLHHLGLAERDRGNVDEARSCWQEVIRLIDEVDAAYNDPRIRAELVQLIADLDP